MKHEKLFSVNFSGHCFMTIKLERTYRRKKSLTQNGEENVLQKIVAQKSINWINKSIFSSCNIESHFYGHQRDSCE